MEHDLQRLIDDPRFRKYHQKIAKRKEFNTFDVLRCADYEIRHSNVLAWLLQPDESHGIGGEFLKWFVNHFNERVNESEIDAVVATDFEPSNVAVERERHNVDIIVVFKKEKTLIAIENKTEEAIPPHFDQVRGYEKYLRARYEQRYSVRSILLSASPDRKVSKQGVVHVSWASVHGEIGALHGDGAFRPPAVAEFVRQYLDVVEGRVLSREAAPDSFQELRESYHSLLAQLLDVLARKGDDGVEGVVPSHQTEFRRTVARLVKDFRREPEHLRSATRGALQRRGFKTALSSDRKAKSWFWLYWEDSVEVERSLGLRSCLRWGMSFTRRRVTVGFFLYQWPRKYSDDESRRMQTVLEQLKEFISKTPVDRQSADQYPNKESGDYFYVYQRALVGAEELSRMSPAKAKGVVLQRLESFLDDENSEYRRIGDYLKCLAFRPEGEPVDDESS